MKRWIVPFLLIVTLNSCKNNSIPDVSGIKVNVSIDRFENGFFNMDTTNMMQSMNALQQRYPYFTGDFIQDIVMGGSLDTTLNLPAIVKQYIRSARPLYDSVQKEFKSLDKLHDELQRGFQFVKYYYPQYKIPKIVTYVGLIGDPSIALTGDAMAIGLQMYLGKNFSAYNTLEAIDKFPQYISRRFEPAYITANCFQNIASDIYPDRSQRLSLLEQMVEKGKQWYLTDKFIPGAADSVKTGFTGPQLEWCKNNEAVMWNYILQGNDLYTTEQNIIQNYIGESPKTGDIDASPGNIGQWLGWQIVKAFAAKNSQLSLQQLLATDPKKLFLESGYKPR